MDNEPWINTWRNFQWNYICGGIYSDVNYIYIYIYIYIYRHTHKYSQINQELYVLISEKKNIKL